MNYTAAFKYIFDKPKWITNVLLGGVCHLIPVVGPIVFQGYQCEVIDARITPMGDGTLAPTEPGAPVNYQVPPAAYPDFDFSRFGEYLMRGLWPFLAVLVMMVPMVFMIFAVQISIFAAIALKVHGVVAALLILCGVVLYLLITLLVPMAMTPVVLRAMLMRSFAAAFNFPFARDFFFRMFWRLLLNVIVTNIVMIPLMIGGLLLCLVGIYPAAAILGLFYADVLAQTYRDYLLRGGMTIAIPAAAAPIVKS